MVIMSLIKDSLGETLYKKAMECVEVLREECCKVCFGVLKYHVVVLLR